MIHLAALKRFVEKPLAELQDLASNPSYTVVDNNFVTVRIQKETVMIKGKYKTLHRVIVSTPDTGAYKNVGWVLNSDISYCTLCLQDFGYFFGSKLHCHACGNIICRSCCEDGVYVKELEQCGGVQVGKCCYWGQEEVLRVPMTPVNLARNTFTSGATAMTLEREQWASSVPVYASLKGERQPTLASSLSADHAPLLRSFSYGGFGGPDRRPRKAPKKAFSVRSARENEEAWGNLLSEDYGSKQQAHVSGTRSTSAIPSSLSRKDQRIRDSAELAAWFTKPAISGAHTQSVDESWQDGLTPECQSFDTFDLGGHGVRNVNYTHKAFQFADAAKHKGAGKIVGYDTTSLTGQRLLTDDSLMHRQEMCLSSREAAALKRASLENNEILVGWQIAILGSDHTLLGLGVVTGVKRAALTRRSLYRISTHTGTDCWLKLRKSVKQAGMEFQPLRKVLYQLTVTSLDT